MTYLDIVGMRYIPVFIYIDLGKMLNLVPWAMHSGLLCVHR